MNTTLAGNNKVSAQVDTLYPFSDTVTTTVNADKAFTYYVRIPSWTTDATISLNGEKTKNIIAGSNGLSAIDLPAGKSSFVLELPAEITIGIAGLSFV